MPGALLGRTESIFSEIKSRDANGHAIAAEGATASTPVPLAAFLHGIDRWWHTGQVLYAQWRFFYGYRSAVPVA